MGAFFQMFYFDVYLNRINSLQIFYGFRIVSEIIEAIAAYDFKICEVISENLFLYFPQFCQLHFFIVSYFQYFLVRI